MIAAAHRREDRCRQEIHVSGWASVNEGTEGPPVYDVVARHIERQKTVRLQPNRHVKVVGADARLRAGMTEDSHEATSFAGGG